MRLHAERGIALLTTMMVMLLLSSLLIGFTVMVASDSQLAAGDLGRTEAFYGAQAGLEQLTSELALLFVTTPDPTAAQVNALEAMPPLIPNTTFEKPDGSSGYEIAFPVTGDGDPATEEHTVVSGPFEGLVGRVTPYTLTVTAKRGEGAESSVERTVQTVRMPIFQFGVFANRDISLFTAQSFTMGGFIHTNTHLFIATSGGPLQLSGRVSAVADVIRTHLPNDYPVDTWGGEVRITTAPGVYRPLAADEGSLVGTLGTAQNEPTWFNLSTGTYNSRLINGRTGARPLELPVSLVGGQPIDLIRRPIPGETAAAAVFQERHFSRASLRFLLSDEITDITSLPGVTGTLPVDLNLVTTWGFAQSLDGTDVATPSAEYLAGYRFGALTPLLGGYLKVEMQTAPGSWTDVTAELLGLGFVGQAVRAAGACAGMVPDATAVIRLQHPREFPVPVPDCVPAAPATTDYWPNVLFDAREGLEREDAVVGTPPHLGGVMHYIELDVGNLAQWFDGTLPGSGTLAIQQPGPTGALDGGYLVYFSDRRTNKNDQGVETGEYGYEDFVNTGADGAPNLIHEPGEDVNASGTLETYGLISKGIFGTPPVFGLPPLGDGARATDTVLTGVVARANPAMLFRRALKLVNGGLGNLPDDGLTVTSENPVYVQGPYNADASGYGDPHAPAAIIADAVTLLSSAWDDWNTLNSAHVPPAAATTYYRFAVATGTSLNFPQPGDANGFGTDGGLHNLLRLLEDWTGQTLGYRGSLAPLWTSRQARGTYKCCGGNVFVPPSALAFEHDADLLDLASQPPAAPETTDVNITGFRQLLGTQ